MNIIEFNAEKTIVGATEIDGINYHITDAGEFMKEEGYVEELTKTITLQEVVQGSLRSEVRTITVSQFLSMKTEGNFGTVDGANITEFGQLGEVAIYAKNKQGN